ncbi:MAG TPA: MltA domain-containing protein, partial [Rhodocyclaceae bacterium]|nr:MltA domain-containing protein [Rhodocyclaceae bacterium]
QGNGQAAAPPGTQANAQTGAQGLTSAPVSAPSPPLSSSSAPLATLPALQCPICQTCQLCPPVKPEPPPAPPYSRAEWPQLPGWAQDDVSQMWSGFLASCRAMRQPNMQLAWISVCEAARGLGDKPDNMVIRTFMESQLQPWQLTNTDGSSEGLITGYYEPLIKGSRIHTKKFNVPVFGVPDDLIVVDLGDLYPDLKNMRLRGRIDGRKLVPYFSRADIEKQFEKQDDGLGKAFPAKVLLWTDDPVEFFFLQIQGSGQVDLTDGSRIRIAYADQNGYPFTSVGRWLIQKGEMKLEQASMQGIQAWAKANPERLSEMLNVNPSYVFFREEPATTDGPKGALGVPLTAGRSIAIDTKSVPLGAPVFLSLTLLDGRLINRLVMAQDTGGAIRGRVRADLFWGFGDKAGAQAGGMRQQGHMWVLWPKGSVPPGALSAM